MAEFFKALFQTMSGNVTRSSCLAPFQWLVGILVAGTVGSFVYDAPPWAIATLLSMSGVSITVFLTLGAWLAAKNPDALRSERYSIRKMELERARIGDHNELLESNETMPPPAPPIPRIEKQEGGSEE